MNGCSKRCPNSKNTASYKERASHGGGVRSNNQTSAYARIEKEFFLIYTKYTYVYMHHNICLYIIYVHTTDNVRPKQWLMLYENLQVFYKATTRVVGDSSRDGKDGPDSSPQAHRLTATNSSRDDKNCKCSPGDKGSRQKHARVRNGSWRQQGDNKGSRRQ